MPAATPADLTDPRYAGLPGSALSAALAVLRSDWWAALTSMPAPSPQSVLDRAACLACLPPGTLDVINTQLLADILLALDAGADVTPQGILDRAGCFACLPPGDLEVIQVVATAEAAEAA